ncbi:MAG: hypothetical protein H0U18_09925 [Pyrinomonadaceae bacterium]|nr:hypothetical protein [Pyrinomonadaceae bacterium]
MTDKEFRDAAVAKFASELAHLRLTTRGLKSFTPPASSEWGKALKDRDDGLALLAQIGAVVEPPPPPPPTGTLPATITAGGIYRGIREGQVLIRTDQPVVIEDFEVRYGGTGYAIDAQYPGAKALIRRGRFPNIGGTGQAIWSYGYDRIEIENCEINGFWGIRLDNGRSGSITKILRNKLRNQVFDEGTNGNGKWLSHPIQTANTSSPGVLEIAWNECIGEFGKSNTEDMISLYNSSYAKVHDNYCQGAYPKTLSGSSWSGNTKYSGGGIIADGPQANFNELYDNIVVDTMNYCVAIAGGHDNKAYRNRAVCDSRNDQGQPFTAISSGGIGFYIADYSNSPSFVNNKLYDSVVGVIGTSGNRNDYWSPIAGAISGITTLPNPIDHQKELAEFQGWQQKVAAAGVKIGI